MHRIVRLTGAAGLALAALALTTGPASASAASGSSRPGGAVFVQTGSVSGNTVVAYRRAAGGTLNESGRYPTGGKGAVLTGAVNDITASQGSLHADRGLLYAVNAGSNTLTTFAVSGDRLTRRQTISSGGEFPSSVTTSGALVYVLNARDGGSVQGYLRLGDRLLKVPAWHRDLGLDPTGTPEFTHTPGQIGFTPDGSKLIVTTKAAGNSVLVFGVTRTGGLTASPMVTTEAGSVPFGFTFDRQGRLVVTEAGLNAVAIYSVSRSGELTLVDRALTGQAATCWVVASGNHVFASNAGSGSLSGYAISRSGTLTSLGNTATDAGTVDAAVTPDGSFLYVQTGAAGVVDEFRLGDGGALTRIGSVLVPDAKGGEGIVAL